MHILLCTLHICRQFSVVTQYFPPICNDECLASRTNPAALNYVCALRLVLVLYCFNIIAAVPRLKQAARVASDFTEFKEDN